MIKEEIKKEVRWLVEDDFSAICRDIAPYNTSYYRVYDGFYSNNNMSYARLFIDCLID